MWAFFVGLVESRACWSEQELSEEKTSIKARDQTKKRGVLMVIFLISR